MANDKPNTAQPFIRILSDFKEHAQQITSIGKDADESETVEILLNSIKRFGQDHIDPDQIDADCRIPQKAINAAAELGLFGLTIDQKYGGAGLSMKAVCHVMQELGQLNCSTGVTIGLHCGLGLRGLNYFASPELQGKYLPDLASGKSIACFSITEPDAGSDIASMRTTAVENEEDNQLVINGSKCFVTNGRLAHLATIVARTPGLEGSRRGHSMILVPLDQPGVTRDPEERKLGIKGSSTSSIHFDNVRVNKDHIIGRPSQGLDHMNHVLSWGRTLMAAGCVGLARAGYQRTLEQITNRRQFNRLIAEFGMVRQKLAFMRHMVHSAENLIRLSTWLEDLRDESISWESSVAKVFCSEAAWLVVDEAVQLHGGSGFIEDVGVARLLRDCRITRIFEGANELMRFHMAAGAFTWKAEELLDCPKLAPQLDPKLSNMGTMFDNLIADLAQALISQKKEHGLKVFQRQMTQKRIADISINSYVILALLARAQGELDNHSGQLDESLYHLTNYGVCHLEKQARSYFAELADNNDELVSQIAFNECQKAGYDLEENVL
jgi:alkylation response protein AidB-like acyl-CoA dehydrogenase